MQVKVDNMNIPLPLGAIGAATGWATAAGTGWAAACRLAGLAAWAKQKGLAQEWYYKVNQARKLSISAGLKVSFIVSELADK